VDAMEAPDCVLRRARLDDAEMLFSWANDSVTRSASFSSEPISWETHRAWLGAKLEDRGCLLFLATAGGGRPVGQLRLDLEGDAAEISVSVGPEHRGLGFGRRLITAGLHEAFRQTGVANVRALIKPENTASVRAFEATGFKRVGETARRGHAAWVFEVARGSFNA
jgi:UDP-2,4-diacetamido-2,4,6-trideoxy-beta-L-altropyranose hydrolase